MNTPTRVGRIEAKFAFLLIGICAIASSLLSCSTASAPPQRIVMFVNFDHDRAHVAFARFVAACEALGIQRRHNVELRFIGVDVTDEVALHRALAQGIAQGPVAIVAPTSPVLMESVRLTRTIPVVFFTHQDPVDLRLTPSLVHRPENLAGISVYLGLESKMLEFLREAAPNARRIGYIFDSDEAPRPSVTQFLDSSSRRHGVQWKLVPVKSIDTLKEDLRKAGDVDAWFVTKAGVLDEHRVLFVSIVASTRRPVIYPSQLEVAAGGPLSYEAVFDDPNGALAHQLDRVLSGVTPSEIPIERPNRFRLSINAGAAKDAGMALTPQLLSEADRVR
jgi:ABC-type uncharacterized transport system, periplasmic component